MRRECDEVVIHTHTRTHTLNNNGKERLGGGYSIRPIMDGDERVSAFRGASIDGERRARRLCIIPRAPVRLVEEEAEDEMIPRGATRNAFLRRPIARSTGSR